ncbi:hypothetical protein [Sabulicella rubraurantiaca]|uniref:hypothetical protein n=1 Tax=Sabulicella rubraurantiaca TaxID=2811429 RepID=UPI001A9780D6|nr:hypothetical protein [Sabulicella rubraurantiaca]
MSPATDCPSAPWLTWCRRTLASLRNPQREPEPEAEPRRLPWYGQVDLPTTHG